MSSESDSAKIHLADRLRRRIRSVGPISFHDWMQAALYDESEGYYSRGDLVRQGRAGDYRTAPETSVLFATTFAQYFLKLYRELGAPTHWTIVEAGAGWGAFASGVLNRFRIAAPAMLEATTYVIDEFSPASRSVAAESLAPFAGQVRFQRLSEVNEPFDQAIVFSNELIDAFPVHRVVGRRGALLELHVDLNETGDFLWVERELSGTVAGYCEQTGLRLAEGQIHEVNLGAERFIERAANAMRDGFLITVDYGATRAELLSAPERFAGTLRAFSRHQLLDDALAAPGAQDLTTTVDWTQVRELAARYGFTENHFERLDRFLVNEGLLEELTRLTSGQTNAAEMVRLQIGAREMIRPDGLAASFQVLVQRKNA